MSNGHDSTTPQENITLGEETEGDALSAEVVPSATLTVVAGRGTGKVFYLVGPENVIGRASNARVRLEDGPVSTQHAVIRRTGDQHFLVDLNSRNGTFLNESRIGSRPVLLGPGDTIRVAETSLSFMPTPTLRSMEQTDHLARLTTGQPFGQPLTNEAQLLVQLLQAAGPVVEQPKPATLEEQIARLERFWATVKRNWLPLVAATALLALAGGIFGMFNPQPVEATVRIRLTARPPAGNPLERWDGADEDEFYASAQENFMSPVLTRQTLIAMGEKSPDPDMVARTLLTLSIKPASLTSTTTFVGTYTQARPDYAVAFLKRHVDGFFASEVQRTIHVTQSEVEFLTGRVKETEEELRRNEAALKAFKDENLEGLPEYAQNLIATRESLLARRAQLSGEATRASLGLSEAKRSLKEETPLLTRRAENAQPFETLLVDARRRLSEARAKGLGEAHPDVMALHKQIQELERLSAQAKSNQSNDFDRNSNANLADLRHRVGDLEAQSKAAGAELGQIEEQLARINANVDKMPEVEARYAQLTRSYSSTKDLYARLFEKLRGSQLQLELERTSAKAQYEILAPPEAEPLKLRRAVLIRALMGAAIGFGIGVAISVLRELRRILRDRRARRTAIVPTTPGQPIEPYGA
jgi:pSer/pThr/pTyr-binding forkhead associated (FHA) protein/uncharacterized protein involved in exopolysaccharide biosynthesis